MLFRDIVCFVILCGKSFGGFDGFGESTVEFNSLMVLVNLMMVLIFLVNLIMDLVDPVKSTGVFDGSNGKFF